MNNIEGHLNDLKKEVDSLRLRRLYQSAITVSQPGDGMAVYLHINLVMATFEQPNPKQNNILNQLTKKIKLKESWTPYFNITPAFL